MLVYASVPFKAKDQSSCKWCRLFNKKQILRFDIACRLSITYFGAQHVEDVSDSGLMVSLTSYSS